MEFAIAIEKYLHIETNSPVGILRSIAKSNVEATNYVLAVRWASFLSELHDDFPYWTNKTQDARALIWAVAYTTLVKYFPQTPGLRSGLLKCLITPFPSTEDSDVWMANMGFIASISQLFEKDPPLVDEIESLLGSADRNVKKTALTLVRNRNDKHMASSVVHLLKTSADRDIQYDCIKTLSILSGYPLISQPVFAKQPDDLIKEWQKIGNDIATGTVNH